MRDQGLLGREFQLEMISQERTQPILDLLGFLPRSVEAEQEIVGVPDISQPSVVRIELIVLSERAEFLADGLEVSLSRTLCFEPLHSRRQAIISRSRPFPLALGELGQER